MKAKHVVIAIISVFALYSCKTPKNNTTSTSEDIAVAVNDTVKIANEKLEYEIIIIEPGFNAWVSGTARPRGYYSQSFLEVRNRLLVTEWNNRVLQPTRYNGNLYELQIDYDPSIDYGYEVNYLLYNYFVYFQLQYKQRLSTFTPRI